MRQIKQLLLLAICAGVFSFQINAQNNPSRTKKNSDARVEKALNQIKMAFELDKDGMYKVTLKAPSGSRRQNAFISSDADDLYGTKERIIFSYAVISDHPASQETANLMLEQNMKSPSHWSIVRLPEGKFATVNFIYIRADADASMLYAALLTITEAADKMEERLTKKDEL